jgi:rhodanese-related sulfurtransferase/predicted transcriptional regulator
MLVSARGFGHDAPTRNMPMDFKPRLFEHFTRITKALGSGNRLRMLELLAQSERSVENLANLTDMSVANTSRHLQQLRRAGLVRSRKEGLHVYYEISGGGVVRLLQALGEVAENNLAEVSQLISQFLTARDDLEPVPHRELLQRARKGLVTVIDVRPPEEFAAGHIAGAINVPLAGLGAWARRAPRGREIVAYCRGPYCVMAFEAVAQLRGKGLRAQRLADGFPQWKSAGLPVEVG